ncbi:hypothetical protein LCGC14_0094220 [marine sediment metagenome]|uniref:PEP-CTERM protein-sorting domain-containing protein n=1 Tax=marine sediment metagenome TaxID=412755 RepID=A0A0F9VU89_9ZZZZ|nr:PEP-CTERM sorting domain-containing protein [Phycisphaerae bacterium]HDZ45202.1 PEP-CTERM sorting domain-containing protein [Phycisphaerae bacterium]
MRTLATVLMAVTMVFAATAQAVPDWGDGGYGMSWSVTYQQLGDGTWEYGYDLYAEGSVTYYDYLALKFDFIGTGTVTDHVLNMYDPGGGPAELREFWTVNGIIGNNGGHWYWGGSQTGVQASYGDLATDTWDTNPTQAQGNAERWLIDAVYAAAEGIANPFHDPSDYARWAGNGSTQGDAAYGLYAGMQGDEWTAGGSYYTPLDTHLAFDMTWFVGGHMYNGSYGPELMATIRIVSDLGPYGSVTAQSYASGTFWFDPIVGPGLSPADFDLDGDVDADDIAILCANMGGDVGTYDLDDSGTVDEDDMIYMIEFMVELQDGSGRVGTKRGDFNLDGLIDGTDLALMKTGFGQPLMDYADGNANCDAFVDGTDLAILKTNFGFIATTGGVPEPMTIGLLSLAAPALLRRRRRSAVVDRRSAVAESRRRAGVGR